MVIKKKIKSVKILEACPI